MTHFDDSHLGWKKQIVVTGVECNNITNHVITLDLSGTNGVLQGEVSSSLLDLEHLQYLDLSFNDFQGTSIPDFIGSFTQLWYLNLAKSEFGGIVPSNLGNLSNFWYLDLGQRTFKSSDLVVQNLDWLSHLSSLRYLDMGYLDLAKVECWLEPISMLSSLIQLHLDFCNLHILPAYVPSVNFTSLTVLDLSGNFLYSSMPLWLFNMSNTLAYLDLSTNSFHGPISEAVGKMTYLEYLSLSTNLFLDGEIPKSLGNLCNLEIINLSANNLSGEMFGFLRNSSRCFGNSLTRLSLNTNELTGSFPHDLGTRFPFLQYLNLHQNQLNGTIPESLGKLAELHFLDVASNFLQGIISEAHFLGLSKLGVLDISSNSLVVSTSTDWVPPFKLYIILMGACKLGPRFPRWLQTQSNCLVLDISNAGISDSVPYWFWNISSVVGYLNLSNNYLHLDEQMPSLSSTFPGLTILDFSSNQMESMLPQISCRLIWLNLSKILFSGHISLLNVEAQFFGLHYLDLSGNLLWGSLPDWWMYFHKLEILNLANNNLSGKIPESLGSLSLLKSLHLQNNSFLGEVSSSIKNCSQIVLIDLGENELSGSIGSWVGESLASLRILRLRSNGFSGHISSDLCTLGQLQMLDLAQNDISGIISICLDNLTSMASMENPPPTIISIAYGSYQEHVLVSWKGMEYEYGNTLSLIRILDLSSNYLYGGIPSEIGSLYGLRSLNFSRNYLMGMIPKETGQLKMLESLDLSRNKLVGVIPASWTSLNFLSNLDLSNNDLSGRIPSSAQLQSFEPSSYAGNPELCGAPLAHRCPDICTTPRLERHGEGRDDYVWYPRIP